MQIVSLSLKNLNALVSKLHRHHKPVQGHRFSIGAVHKGNLVGGTSVGRPVARNTDQWRVLEVTRLVTDGTPNACSFLYSAAARVGKELGYERIQTFILASEPGTSLRAAGWTFDGESRGGDWTRASKPNRRQDQPQTAKHRYVKLLNKEIIMTLPSRPNLGQALQEGLRRPMPPHVSLKGNRFTLVDAAGRTEPVDSFDPKSGPYLDCVICDVNAKVSRIFYADSYDADNPGPPDCFSDNGVAPSVNASSPQATRCDICPQAEWGSATSNLTGKGIPACRSYKKLAILLEKYPSMVFMIAIPPASLNAVGDYAKVCNGYKVDVMDVLTRISFMPDKMGILVFEPKDHASEDMKARVNKVWENPDGAGHIIGRFDQPRQAVIEHKPPSPVRDTYSGQFGSEPEPTAPATASPFTSSNMQQAAQKEAKKPRGRPRTVVDAPKNALEPQSPFKPGEAGGNPFGSAPPSKPASDVTGGFGGTVAAPSTNGQAEQGKFGVVENPPAPDASMGKVLDNLFGTKFE